MRIIAGFLIGLATGIGFRPALKYHRNYYIENKIMAEKNSNKILFDESAARDAHAKYYDENFTFGWIINKL